MTENTGIALTDYATLDEVSLTLVPGVTLDDIGAMKGILSRRSGAYRWYIGDLLVQAEALYGEAHTQLLEEYEAQTLAGYQWLSSKIPPDFRDPEMPHSYYKDIAKLDLKTIGDLVDRFRAESPSRDVWVSWVAEAKGEVPKERQKRDLTGAVDYLRSHEGKVWGPDDTLVIRNLILS